MSLEKDLRSFMTEEQKNDRDYADKWWRSLSINQMKELELKYFIDWRFMTLSKITEIWVKEVKNLKD
jgi:hypothetical protein